MAHARRPSSSQFLGSACGVAGRGAQPSQRGSAAGEAGRRDGVRIREAMTLPAAVRGALTPTPQGPPTSPSHPHAAAATRKNYYNISLLRIPIIVRQRVDVDVVVRALEVQVLALHV